MLLLLRAAILLRAVAAAKDALNADPRTQKTCREFYGARGDRSVVTTEDRIARRGASTPRPAYECTRGAPYGRFVDASDGAAAARTRRRYFAPRKFRRGYSAERSRATPRPRRRCSLERPRRRRGRDADIRRTRAAATRRVRGDDSTRTVGRRVARPRYLAALGRVARQMMGGGVGSVGARRRTRRARAFDETGEPVTFESVAGIDAAKREVAELVALTSGASARAYAALGARPPRGVLLVGPPGTGKTLLARALATSARAPFLSCSGSEFVEMFVGRGAARVRQLFDRAKSLAPCVVFIDEIDALGRRRRENNFSLGGANDEVEQTLNQLLACMDGVDANNGVVVLAATNRLNILDPALVRPGRFDRVVKVPPPDLLGRESILRVHAKKVAVSSNVDLGAVAKETKGLVGADLAAVVNEAAIRAARRGGTAVEMRDMKLALAEFYESRSAFTGDSFGPFSFAGGGKGDQPAS